MGCNTMDHGWNNISRQKADDEIHISPTLKLIAQSILLNVNTVGQSMTLCAKFTYLCHLHILLWFLFFEQGDAPQYAYASKERGTISRVPSLTPSFTQLPLTPSFPPMIY